MCSASLWLGNGFLSFFHFSLFFLHSNHALLCCVSILCLCLVSYICQLWFAVFAVFFFFSSVWLWPAGTA